MNHTLEKINNTTWLTKDRQYAILKAFGRNRFWIGKLSIHPEEKVLWSAERCVEKDFPSWREARSYLIHNIYGR